MPTRGPVFHVNDLGGATRTTAGASQPMSGGSIKIPPEGVFGVYGLIWPDFDTLTGFSDNAGTPNNWVIAHQFNRGGVSPGVAIVAAFIADNSYTTLTATFSGSVAGMEWSGVYFAPSWGGCPPLDATPIDVDDLGGTTSTLQKTLTLTDGGAGMFAFQCIANVSNATGQTPSANWNEIDDAGNATIVTRINSATWIDGTTAKPSNFGRTSGGATSTAIAMAAWKTDAPTDVVRQPGLQVYRCMPAIQKALR